MPPRSLMVGLRGNRDLPGNFVINFIPNSEIAMGGTGNLPVPPGYQPDGTGVNLRNETDAQKKCGRPFSIPGGW
jgi:hypothetical protein